MSLSFALVEADANVLQLPEDIADHGTLGSARLVGERNLRFHRSGDALLVGWAFRRYDHSPCDILSDAEVAAIMASCGGWAVDKLWGNFILAWAGPEGDIFLLRSPVTGPALYQVADRPAHGQDGGNSVRFCAFTDLALARALGFPVARLDPEIVDAELRFPMLRRHRTGIAGVREIFSGEITRLGSDDPAAHSWSPARYMLRPPGRVEPEALHQLVSSMVSAWSARFDRVQLELSGGLDSSIVAACLANRTRPWRAINLATSHPDGDERRYARQVAARVGVELEELMLARDTPDPLALPTRPRVRAGGFGLLGPTDTALLDAALDYGAEAIFTGAGGDNIFGFLTSPGPIIDALRFAGPHTAWRAAKDLARITGDDLWTVGRVTWLRQFKPARLWPVESLFLSQRFAESQPEHPWFANIADTAPGQRAYALKLLLIQPFLDGYDRSLAMPMIAPLLSQPLVEFGLGVPSWQWGEGGQDRALARRAFADDLPQIILDRRSKGRIVSMFFPVFDAHRARLLSYLLEGHLASEGLLDRGAIEDFVLGRAGSDPVKIIRLLHVVDMERWARSVAGSF